MQPNWLTGTVDAKTPTTRKKTAYLDCMTVLHCIHMHVHVCCGCIQLINCWYVDSWVNIACPASLYKICVRSEACWTRGRLTGQSRVNTWYMTVVFTAHHSPPVCFVIFSSPLHQLYSSKSLTACSIFLFISFSVFSVLCYFSSCLIPSKT